MKTLIGIFIGIIIVAGLYWVVETKGLTWLGLPTTSTSPTPTATAVTAYDQSISDGTITVAYPSTQFGLATTPGQVLVTAYIPPCDQGFNYCLYYTGTQYQGTNFESAGLRIQKRSDIAAERLCVNTPPAGYSASVTPAATASNNTYVASVFTPIGNAAAGHYANGSLYRLFIRSSSSCYEFETRIGQTQFANYPAGTIKQFTASDQTILSAQLRGLIDTITLKDGTKVMFPQTQ
jgi:hypothetical protein